MILSGSQRLYSGGKVYVPHFLMLQKVSRNCVRPLNTTLKVPRVMHHHALSKLSIKTVSLFSLLSLTKYPFSMYCNCLYKDPFFEVRYHWKAPGHFNGMPYAYKGLAIRMRAAVASSIRVFVLEKRNKREKLKEKSRW